MADRIGAAKRNCHIPIAIGSRKSDAPAIHPTSSGEGVDDREMEFVTTGFVPSGPIGGIAPIAAPKAGGAARVSTTIGTPIRTGGVRMDAAGNARSAPNVTASIAWRTDARFLRASRAAMRPKAAITVALARVVTASELLSVSIVSLISGSMAVLPFLAHTVDLTSERVQFFVAPRCVADERNHHLPQRTTAESLQVLLQRVPLSDCRRCGGRVDVAETVLAMFQEAFLFEPG